MIWICVIVIKYYISLSDVNYINYKKQINLLLRAPKGKFFIQTLYLFFIQSETA